MKTAELTGVALDWAVAKCEGFTDLRRNPHRFTEEWDWIMTPPRVTYGPVWLHDYKFSTSWKDGGPIIERLDISISKENNNLWVAQTPGHEGWGYTPLIAAMRCYCCAKLGEEIEIPEELK